MQLPDIGQLLATASPAVILVAVIVGVLVFFLLRFVVRSFHIIIQLGCLVIVVLAVIYILRSVLKIG
jgi:hypothetical protein